MDPHRLAELRSLALHRVIAERVLAEPALVEKARRNVEAWTASGALSAHYRDAWLEVLSRPAPRIAELLVEDTEHARELRQTTPFTGVVSARHRWAIWRAARETQ